MAGGQPSRAAFVGLMVFTAFVFLAGGVFTLTSDAMPAAFAVVCFVVVVTSVATVAKVLTAPRRREPPASACSC
ncbi:hypothetical protein [Actinopolymorpha pittospori]|uniref:Uncharacterized protein n=1 Tax=Actinopolymorpha pittospori TaxID=648752 RepID=A0A927R6L0_9ACTN|nr:hypothetical protein [Actinopolymorpha pittospori]MBE1604547.1 hypothetical protein [Actinopolymorpha pittospori]